MLGWLDLYALYFFVPARLDSIALGGLGSFGYYGYLQRSRLIGCFAGIAALIMVWAFQYIPLRNPVMPLIGYLVFGFILSVFVAWLAVQPLTGTRKSLTYILVRLAAPFGKLSYFIYLFHMFVLEALLALGGRFENFPVLGFWSALLASASIAYGLAVVSWKYFEHPLIMRSKIKQVMVVSADARGGK
jgi:peptidoglycan/LPS O-acetylase OafA/YrhL